MIKFKFKRTNQNAIPHYRRPAPAVGSTAWLGSDVGGTARPGQATALLLTRSACSPQAGDSATAAHWNQPKNQHNLV
jgi:hypothetical protein